MWQVTCISASEGHPVGWLVGLGLTQEQVQEEVPGVGYGLQGGSEMAGPVSHSAWRPPSLGLGLLVPCMVLSLKVPP